MHDCRVFIAADLRDEPDVVSDAARPGDIGVLPHPNDDRDGIEHARGSNDGTIDLRDG